LKRLLWVTFALALASASQSAGFRLTDTDGKTHSLEAYRGKWVLVNFWATWCPPCLDEIPDFVSLYDARKDKDFMVIGIAMDYQNSEQVKEFAENLFMSYPLVLGDHKVAAQFGQVSVLPVSFLYDPRGKLALQRVGPLTKEILEKYLNLDPAVDRLPILENPDGY